MKYLSSKKKAWQKGELYNKRVLLDLMPKTVNLMQEVLIPAKTTVPPHAHRATTEVFYVVGGKAIIIVDNKKLAVNEGDVLIVKKGEKHGVITKKQELKLLVLKVNFVPGDSYNK